MYFIYFHSITGEKIIHTHCDSKEDSIELLKKTAIKFIKKEEGPKKIDNCIIFSNNDMQTARTGHLLKYPESFEYDDNDEQPPKIRVFNKKIEQQGFMRGYSLTYVPEEIGFFSIISYDANLQSVDKLETLQHNLNLFKNRIKTLEDLISNQEEIINKRDRIINDQKIVINDQEEIINNQTKTLDENDKIISNQEKENNKITELVQTNKNLKNELDELLEELENVDTEFNTIEIENQHFKLIVNDHKKTIKDNEKQIENQNEIICDQMKIIDEQKNIVDKHMERINEQNETIDKHVEKINEQKNMIKQLQKENEGWEDTVEIFVQQSNMLDKRHAALEEDYLELRNKSQNLVELNKYLNEENKNLTKENAQLVKEINDLDAEINRLIEKTDTFIYQETHKIKTSTNNNSINCQEYATVLEELKQNSAFQTLRQYCDNHCLNN